MTFLRRPPQAPWIPILSIGFGLRVGGGFPGERDAGVVNCHQLEGKRGLSLRGRGWCGSPARSALLGRLGKHLREAFPVLLRKEGRLEQVSRV